MYARPARVNWGICKMMLSSEMMSEDGMMKLLILHNNAAWLCVNTSCQRRGHFIALLSVACNPKGALHFTSWQACSI